MDGRHYVKIPLRNINFSVKINLYIPKNEKI